MPDLKISQLAVGAPATGTEVIPLERTASANYSLTVQNIHDYNKPFVNVRDSGAVGDGVTDDTAAIVSAFGSVARGGTVYFPGPGKFLVKGAGTEIFLIQQPVNVVGDGWGAAATNATTIIVDATVSSTTDIFHFKSADTWNGGGMRDIMILPQSGTPGRHAVFIETPVGVISNFKISHCYLGNLGGFGIRAYNSGGVVTGGFFTSVIEDCLIDNGIRFIAVGDSLSIHRNSITLLNGIDVDLISGAALLTITYNNFTGKGGVHLGANCSQAKIHDNQFEGTAGTTVNVDSALGQKVLRVVDTTNFLVGEVIAINQGGARAETGTVASIQAGVSLTLVANLTFTHTAAQADTVTAYLSNGAMIDIDGDVSMLLDSVELHSNRFSPVGANLDTVRVNYANYCMIHHNHLDRASGGKQIRITANATNTIIRDNKFLPENETIAVMLADAGANTIFAYPYNGVDFFNSNLRHTGTNFYIDSNNGAASGIVYFRDGSGFTSWLTKDGSGHVGINTLTPAAVSLDVNGTFRVNTVTPASSGAAGVAGQIAWDANYIYVCIATNTWKRVAIATW